MVRPSAILKLHHVSVGQLRCLGSGLVDQNRKITVAVRAMVTRHQLLA